MLTAACQCGAVRHRVAVTTPGRICVCRCAECRAQTASAFGIPEIVPRDAMRLPQSAPRLWFRATASGKMLACAIDTDCGPPNLPALMPRVPKMSVCALNPNSDGHIRHHDIREGADMSNKRGACHAPADLTGTAHLRTIAGVVPSCDAPPSLRDHD